MQQRSIVLPWSPAAETAGLRRDAGYLIRPDGHVGLACPSNIAAALETYVQRLGLDFTQAGGSGIRDDSQRI